MARRLSSQSVLSSGSGSSWASTAGSSASSRFGSCNRIQLQRKCDSWRAELVAKAGELDDVQLAELRAAVAANVLPTDDERRLPRSEIDAQLLIEMDLETRVSDRAQVSSTLRAPLPESQRAARIWPPSLAGRAGSQSRGARR
ncbi:hypothetical protein DIPPA_22024 [Diplonema papillatum]|nr:hypothetical protein DIPPA_22024 [Diplonema papillatum]